MIQNIIILIIVIACAWFIGRRIYNNLSRSQPGCGCGSSCSDCGSDVTSSCNSSTTEQE